MNSFPLYLNPQNINNFEKYHNEMRTTKLREQLYKHILTEPEGEFCDISDYPCEIVTQVTNELIELKWKIKFIFNNTCIIIYFNEENLTNWGVHI